MPDLYNPASWYWLVSGQSGYWSSASSEYVDNLPEGAGVTRIASEQELCDVLEKAGHGDRAPWSLEEWRARKLAEIKRSAQAAADAYMSSYPEFETLTWESQEREARAYVADSEVATPTLAPIAQARGLSVADLAQRVIAKADAFRAAAAAIMGQRQALEDQIMAAATVEEVRAIGWPQ